MAATSESTLACFFKNTEELKKEEKSKIYK